MGEQRGSFCTSGANSARSSYDPEADQYTAKYRDNSESNDKKDQKGKGLSKQVIMKNTLDRDKPDFDKIAVNRNQDDISATAGALADDNES